MALGWGLEVLEAIFEVRSKLLVRVDKKAHQFHDEQVRLMHGPRNIRCGPASMGNAEDFTPQEFTLEEVEIRRG